jgi:outer membrane biosynthesis protein TonB
MSQAQAAAAMERLPWLADEPKPAPPPKGERRGSGREIAGWGVAVILLVAIASYWMGAHSWAPSAPQTESGRPSTTAAIPQAQPATPQQQAEPQPQVNIEPAPQVTPVPERQVPIARPRAERRTVVHRPALKREVPSSAKLDKVVAEQKAEPAAAKPAANPDSKPLKAWPASQSQGAQGRIVRIGAFGTRQQAKLGWRHMVRAYPAVAHLKATVVSDRNSRGRYFYRFQMGTTSQAHSEVLCQRMERIHFSCAVVGLPWKPKGVER